MGVIWVVAAAGWAVAEASLFFIVPDVVLTAAVIRLGLGKGFRLSVIAALSASLTEAAMWLWGEHDAASARSVMLMIPAIGPDLLARTQHEIAGIWPFHLLVGAVTGVPYKLYAVEAGAHGINPAVFVLASFAARLTRFSLTACAAALTRYVSAAVGRPRLAYGAWAFAWLAVYAVYFTLRGLI